MLEGLTHTPMSNRSCWLQEAQKLMGEVHTDQLRFVDCYVSYPIGLLVPVVGPCMAGLKHLHAHPAYSFDFALDDRGKLRIENQTIHTKRGNFYALYPGVRHHQLRTDSIFRYIAVFIDKEFFERQWQYYHRSDSNFRNVSFAFDTRMIALLKDFMNEFECQLPARQVVLESLATKITHEIIRKMLGLKQTHQRETIRQEINRAVELIHAHFDRDLSVRLLAKCAHMSRSNFTRVFRKELGRSPLQYLLSVRLERARKLLQSATQSVTDIALQCGFSTLSQFSISFSKRYGTSPSAYRKAFQ